MFTKKDMYPRDDCWICLCSSSLEQHHIIPRAYGGSNGPLCTLCSVCHSAIHKLSYESDYINAHGYGEWDEPMIKKGWYLATTIKRSRELMVNEQRNIKAMLTLDPKTNKMLKLLTLTLNSTQEKTILYAIEQLYTRIIGDPPP